jgi:hypothetical protein
MHMNIHQLGTLYVSAPALKSRQPLKAYLPSPSQQISSPSYHNWHSILNNPSPLSLVLNDELAASSRALWHLEQPHIS